jgi:hypothetical protein
MLKAKICPSDYAYETDLGRQYEALKKAPKKAPRTSLEQWVNRWEEVYYKAKRFNLPEVRTPRPHIDFLTAIQNTAPAFYAANYNSILKRASRGEDVDFIELLNDFREDRRIHQAKHGNLQASVS